MSSLSLVFEELNELCEQGQMERYAVVGELAALFYAEVSARQQLEILVPFESPFFQNLVRSQATPPLQIHGVPVFVFAVEDAEDEVLMTANVLEYGGVFVPVAKPEFLTDRNPPATRSLDAKGLAAKYNARLWEHKKAWHRQQASIPIEDKMGILIELQKRDLPLLALHRPLKWFEKPWDIEP